MLSVIIITKNEAASIKDCLESVAWADEIIVVDSGSTDKTVEICESFSAKVYVTDWPGFGPQKNRAIDYATQTWLLSIDADERVPPELKTEIQAIIQQPNDINGYYIPRLSYYCGQPIHHSGWRPDYTMRLFKSGSGRFKDVLVHETVEIEGKTAKLKHSFVHYSYENFEEVLDKMNKYSTYSAIQLHQAGKKCALPTVILKGLWSFFRTYVFRLGFLDGRKGLMLAISNAETTYYKYLKLWELNQRDKS